MTDGKGVLFILYHDTLGLLGVEDALRICEEVYGMHARGSVVLSSPPSFKLDVHFNRLLAGGSRGKRHHHTTADNVYIVKRGEGTLTVDGETHIIRENDVVYIPAGMVHSLANLSDDVFEIFEIYAPAGARFDFVLDE